MQNQHQREGFSVFPIRHWKRYLLTASLLAVSVCLLIDWNPPSKRIIDCKGNPHPSLVQLFKLTQVPFRKGMPLKEITENTRQYWLQGAKKERWKFDNHFESQRTAILSCLQALKMVSNLQPEKKSYTYAWVHGALAPTIKLRIEYLVAQWKQGIRFQEVVLLAGDRNLDPKKEAMWIKKGMKTEAEVMLWLWENTPKPKTLQALPYRLVKAVQWLDQEGKQRRPGTKDTIWAWLKQYPNPGTILAISNQPFCAYQQASAVGVLPKGFKRSCIIRYDFNQCVLG